MTDLRTLERLIKTLGSFRRLRIIAHLQRKDAAVKELAQAAGVRIFAASQHLRILRNAGIVEETRRGVYVVYRLSRSLDPIVREVLKKL